VSPFVLSEFLSPLSTSELGAAFLIGLAFGYAIYGRRPISPWAIQHIYWMLATGVIFFVPLSLERATEGSTTWPRFLATLVIWDTFILGTAVTPIIRRVRRRKKP
jgi:hypothetical protein